MANGRLKLECSVCLNTYTLAKYWGGGEFNPPAPTSVEGQHNERMPLDEWLTAHTRSCLLLFDSDLKQLKERFRLIAD